MLNSACPCQASTRIRPLIHAHASQLFVSSSSNASFICSRVLEILLSIICSKLWSLLLHVSVPRSRLLPIDAIAWSRSSMLWNLSSRTLICLGLENERRSTSLFVTFRPRFFSITFSFSSHCLEKTSHLNVLFCDYFLSLLFTWSARACPILWLEIFRPASVSQHGILGSLLKLDTFLPILRKSRWWFLPTCKTTCPSRIPARVQFLEEQYSVSSLDVGHVRILLWSQIPISSSESRISKSSRITRFATSAVFLVKCIMLSLYFFLRSRASKKRIFFREYTIRILYVIFFVFSSLSCVCVEFPRCCWDRDVAPHDDSWSHSGFLKEVNFLYVSLYIVTTTTTTKRMSF